MKDVERMTKEIKLLQLCIDNSHGEIMPDCETPEIKTLFDELTKDAPLDMREVRWWALEKTSVPAKELQIQLLEEKIKQQEAVLERRESAGIFTDDVEDPDHWGEDKKPTIADHYSKKSTNYTRKRKSDDLQFDGPSIENYEFVTIKKASTDKDTTDEIALTFDDLGW